MELVTTLQKELKAAFAGRFEITTECLTYDKHYFIDINSKIGYDLYMRIEIGTGFETLITSYSQRMEDIEIVLAVLNKAASA